MQSCLDKLVIKEYFYEFLAFIIDLEFGGFILHIFTMARANYANIRILIKWLKNK